MQYTVFITLEPYLLQWLIHECGGETPIKLKKNSAEADIMQMWLTKPPRRKEWTPQLKPLENQVEVVIPCFKKINIRCNYFLPEEGKRQLHECIKNRFRVQLWKELHTIGNVIARTDKTISDWMEAHGIEDNDTNWNTIAKTLQRKRAVYCPNNRLTNHRSSKHKRKIKIISSKS